MNGPVDPLIRAAGGRPAVVRPLATALRREAAGVQELMRTRAPGRFMLTAEGAHILALVVAALGSVGLLLAVILLGGQGRPGLAAVAMSAAHVVFLSVTIVGQTVPAMLRDDDAVIVGWWPVTLRELLLARLGTVLVPALQISVALLAAPLAAFAVVGAPPVGAALLLGLALLAQVLVLALVAASVTAAVIRLAGPRRARRLGALVVDGNLGIMPFLLLPFADRIFAWLRHHPSVVGWLPPAWFAAFGDPLAGPAAWRGMALAAAFTGLTAAGGWRLATRRGGAPVPLAEGPPPRVRRHWSDLVLLLLRPWLRGREGWVTGRLLAAHLREDWRFGGNMLFGVLLACSLLWYYTRADQGDEDAVFGLLMGGSQILMLMAITIPFVTTFSSSPRALWIVALADLDPVRLLAAQRGMIHVLFTAPVLVVFAARGVGLQVPPGTTLLLLVIMALEAELLMLVGQRIHPLMAFSREFTQDQSARAVARGFALVGVFVAMAVVNGLAGAWVWSRWGLAASLPVAVAFAARAVARRVAGSRLNFAEIVR